MTSIYNLTISKSHQSCYLIGEHSIDQLPEQLALLNYDQIYMVYDSHLPTSIIEKCLAQLNLPPEHCLPISGQEKHKNLDTVNDLLERFYQIPLSPHCLLLAIGGGVIGDIVGFTASIYKRGISWAFIPTSLIAQVDSCIGGKTAVNTEFGKNLLGTFHFPHFVIADVHFLQTLPKRHFQAGMAEVIKIAAMTDHSLLNQLHGKEGLLEDSKKILPLIEKAALLKISVVEDDPFESKDIGRNRLNFGHTIGHALEKVYQGKILHGEAIASGMIAELEIAQKMDIWPQPCLWITNLKRLICKLIPLRKDDLLPSWQQLMPYLLQDKKNSRNKLRFVIPHLTRGAQQIIFNIQEQTLPNCLDTDNMSVTTIDFKSFTC